MERFEVYRKWLCRLYVNTMNVIHYMHDKYAYEKIQMALHDTDVERFMAFGVAGLSVIADSLSAIKYARVRAIRDEEGLIVDFETTGDFPKYGNDDDRVDDIAKEMLTDISDELKKTPAYRGALHTLSVLTITSNVMYGKKTGSTPDGRKTGEPFAPGANPMHNRETNGALASLNSVAKMPYAKCRDGISNTFSITPAALGQDQGGTGGQPGGGAGRVLQADGPSSERQRHEPAAAHRRVQRPLQVPQPDHPGLRVRGEFPQAVPGAAAGGHQPDLP